MVGLIAVRIRVHLATVTNPVYGLTVGHLASTIAPADVRPAPLIDVCTSGPVAVAASQETPHDSFEPSPGISHIKPQAQRHPLSDTLGALLFHLPSHNRSQYLGALRRRGAASLA